MKEILNLKTTKNRIQYDLINNDKLIIEEVENDVEKAFNELQQGEEIEFSILKYNGEEYELKTWKIENNEDLKGYNKIIEILENKKITIRRTNKGLFIER